MWAEYFPNGEIHGADIRAGYEYLETDRIKTHELDQSQIGELIIFGEQYPDYFSVICDDGSHVGIDMLITFETLFKYLKPGGYYILEDVLCSYDSRWNEDYDILKRIRQMVGEVQMGGNIPNSHICANKKEAVKKYGGTYYDKHLEWLLVACGTVIIKKM
jgi:hypothetical protein